MDFLDVSGLDLLNKYQFAGNLLGWRLVMLLFGSLIQYASTVCSRFFWGWGDRVG